VEIWLWEIEQKVYEHILKTGVKPSKMWWKFFGEIITYFSILYPATVIKI